MGLVDAFKKFNANLKNSRWSVSAINSNNVLIMSIWGHRPLLSKHPTEQKYIYRNRIDRWSGHGRNELKEYLDIALESKLKIRPIISELDNADDFQHILDGKAANQYPKKFNAEMNLIGELTLWDGVNFEIEFSPLI